ncbi:MAG: hypothetical protein GY854_31240 [Deltaproteobacteria bacterium]|nr:hypothetical protein [Deltaproteobacteria bacterium]
MNNQDNFIDRSGITAEHPVMGAAHKKDERKTLLQDFLIYVVKGISMYAHRARQLSVTDREIDIATMDILHKALSDGELTVDQLADIIGRAKQIRNRAKTLYEWACGPWAKKPEGLKGPAALKLETTPRDLLLQAQGVCSMRRHQTDDNTNLVLEKLCMDKLKKAAEKALFSRNLDTDDHVYAFCHEVLNSLSSNPSTEELTGLARRI